MEIARANNGGGPVSPWTFKREVQDFGGQQWRMTISTLPMVDEEARSFAAFLTGLRGNIGRFRHGDPYRSLPRGAVAGAPVIAAATAGQQEVSVSGLTASTLRQFAVDDYIEIDGSLYTVLVDTDSDALGNATVPVWPDLRSSYAVSTEIVYRNPRGTWRLKDNSLNITRDVLMRSSMLISCEEAI